jgi:hypothetical protein
MEITREQLVERFRTLSDDEVVRRAQSGSLTELAKEVAADELSSRGIRLAEPEPPQNQDDSTQDEDESSTVDLVTVAQFTSPIKANVLRGCLESHGIFAHVWGEHLGVAHVFLSIASGGVRVQVRADQEAEAREIMAAVERGEFNLQDSE